MILDCGEGSLSQLVRLHGVARAQQILRDLKAVYVSHQHADHHLGESRAQQILRDLKAVYVSHQHADHHLGESRAQKILRTVSLSWSPFSMQTIT
jgi:ribonuclease BN (tRNA processing enzyme)